MLQKYSIWLMPSGKVYNKLAKIISQLSEKYSSPHFEPHITLLGLTIGAEEEVITKTFQLAKILQPFEITFNKVDYSDEYFRILFIRVKETKDIMEANLKAREIFNRQGDPKYIPHLSLMYGNFSPEIKEKIIKDIGGKFNIRLRVKSIHLFKLKTKGDPKSWCKIKEFVLKK